VKEYKEIRFIQIACAYNGESRVLYGLTQEGKVYFYSDYEKYEDWIPLGMKVKEEE